MKYLPLLSLFFLFFSCREAPKRANEKPLLVCTTGMVADAVKTIVGDVATVRALMGPGVDPHLFKATQSDLTALMDADAIFYNGLHLEGKMGEILEKLGRQKPVIAVGEGLPKSMLINSTTYADAHDPHVWFDVAMWAQVVQFTTQELIKLYPQHRTAFTESGERYVLNLMELDAAIKKQIELIPEEQRVLVTAHDAFTYFGRAYGIEVRGLQGISTVSEYGLRDVANLVNYLTENKIKAVFVESSVPRKSLEAVVEGCSKRGHNVVIGGTLFSDAMGSPDTEEGTYVGMVRHNVNTIMLALR